ncbi:hypothetical protein [Peptoniphilus duerdenii]|uniref:hypothetical protein n=1 Tax=Peptoniphilus duerdenii TaxID=507750 RepID=UPI00288C067A|nr:hypothetical protein [Peptoniphilus duerdenii]
MEENSSNIIYAWSENNKNIISSKSDPTNKSQYAKASGYTDDNLITGYNIDNKFPKDDEVLNMENNWLKEYIGQLEKDSKDFKAEMRERDQRSEQRLIEAEKKYTEQNKRSEDRMNQSMNEIRKTFESIETKLEDTKKTVMDMEKQNRNFSIANFLAISALVIAAIIGFMQINSSFLSLIRDLAK